MIVILGESASGKSTVQDILCKNYGYVRLITYTTRSPRKGEENGVDYHFISEDTFEEMSRKGEFCETAEYNGWHYATAKADCTNNKVVVLTPHGLRQMKKIVDLTLDAFYINVPRRDRLVKILQRGDNIEEAYRRSLSDVGQFDGIGDEVDLVICNPGYEKSPKEIAEEIISRLRR
uniref:guanylate kinase n=1 Tax=Clostridium sp. 12(A) TaxID=1163671 RepID=UPI0004653DD5|nr:guanylate kinase [Clostridium sp. 12(A)]